MEFDQRPWGAWYALDRGDGYQVKRIVVTPGQRLSYQTHRQRAEHWVVVGVTSAGSRSDSANTALARSAQDVAAPPLLML